MWAMGIPTALLPGLLTATLGAPAAALGVIEGLADGLAGAARLGGGAIADDPVRRRSAAVGGYTATAVLSAGIGVAGSVAQVAVLRVGAWAARGLRVPSRNALLADAVPADAYGRAYGFERAMDNLDAIIGPLLALGLVGIVGSWTGSSQPAKHERGDNDDDDQPEEKLRTRKPNASPRYFTISIPVGLWPESSICWRSA